MGQTGRRWTNISMQRLALFIVLTTILVGQATIVKEQGTFGEVAGLYHLSVGALFVYAFYPQLVHSERKVRRWVGKKRSARGATE